MAIPVAAKLSGSQDSLLAAVPVKRTSDFTKVRITLVLNQYWKLQKKLCKMKQIARGKGRSKPAMPCFYITLDEMEENMENKYSTAYNFIG